MNSICKGGNLFKVKSLKMRNCQRGKHSESHGHGHPRHHGQHCKYQEQQPEAAVAAEPSSGFCGHVASELHHHGHHHHHGERRHHMEHHQHGHHGHHEKGHVRAFGHHHHRRGGRFNFMRHHQQQQQQPEEHGFCRYRQSRSPSREHSPMRHHHRCGRSSSRSQQVQSHFRGFRGRRHSFSGRFPCHRREQQAEPAPTSAVNID